MEQTVRETKTGKKINGKIYRSVEWLKERIVFLEQRVRDYKQREQNALKEIESRLAELKLLENKEEQNG